MSFNNLINCWSLYKTICLAFTTHTISFIFISFPHHFMFLSSTLYKLKVESTVRLHKNYIMRWSGLLSCEWQQFKKNNNNFLMIYKIQRKFNLKPVHRSHFNLLFLFIYFESQMKMITCRSVFHLILTKVWWLDQMLRSPG